MRFRYRKSFKIAPGVRVNLSKSGVGVSADTKGVRVGIGPRGTYTSVGISGTGIYAIDYHKRGREDPNGGQRGSDDGSADAFPVPGELQKTASPIGCLGILVGLVFLFSAPGLGLLVIAGSLIVQSRNSNAKALRLYNQANKCAKKGNHQGAVSALKEVLKIKPDLAAAKLDLGLLYFSQEKYEEAISQFEEYLRINEDEAVRFQLALAHMQAENHEQALGILQSLSQETKQELDYILALGSVFLDMGKPDLTLQVLRTGPTRKRSMDQKIALFRYLLGLAYIRLDDKKRALAEFKKVYVFDKDFHDVSEYLAQLEQS